MNNNSSLFVRFAFNLVRWSWVLYSLYVIIYPYYLLSTPNPPHGDYAMGVAFQMLLLSFPIGFLAFLFGALISRLHIEMLNNLFVLWLPFFVFGYFQWFVLLPKVAIGLQGLGKVIRLLLHSRLGRTE